MASGESGWRILWLIKQKQIMSMSPKVYGLEICCFKGSPWLQQGARLKAGCISQIVALTRAEKNLHS